MAEDVFTLFDEYAVRYARGERPDARAYLTRAGEGADDLAELLERFLAAAPAPPTDEDLVAAFEAWLAGDPPLLELRIRRGLRRDEVVDGLIERLSLDRAKREKVKRYYHRLETGLLEPSGVDRRVFEALGEALRARVEDLLAWRPRPLEAAAYLRADADAAAAPPTPPAALIAKEAVAEPDEIDALFTQGRVE